MKNRILLGYIFLITAILGGLFCIYAITQVWRYQAVAVNATSTGLEILSDTVDTTREGLLVIQDLVATTEKDVAIFQSAIQTITLSASDTTAILASLSQLTSSELPAALIATQTSLASAQTSAQLIDDMLAGIGRIPLLGLGAYQPEIPLSTAIGDISKSLEPLSPTLSEMSQVLDRSANNIYELEEELQRVSTTAQELQSALAEGQGVIAGYQEIMIDLSNNVEKLQIELPLYIRGIAWLLTFFLVPVLFSQIGLAERGAAILHDKNLSAASKPDQDPASIE